MKSAQRMFVSVVAAFALGFCLLSGCGGGSMGGSLKATLSATSLTFGSEAVGTPSPAQTITLSNSGTGTLSNVSIGAPRNATNDLE